MAPTAILEPPQNALGKADESLSTSSTTRLSTSSHRAIGIPATPQPSSAASGFIDGALRHILHRQPSDHPAHDISHRSCRSIRSVYTVDGLPEVYDVNPSEMEFSAHLHSHRTLTGTLGESAHGTVVPTIGEPSVHSTVGPGGPEAAVHILTVKDDTPDHHHTRAHTARAWVIAFFKKWCGGVDTPLPIDAPVDIFWSWLGAFLSILLVACLNQYFSPTIKLPLMIASFGASAVLLFGVPASKLAQPRNLLGGHVISALVGIIVRLVVRDLQWLSSALGMSLALTAMQLTRTTHPPGGATALIAASIETIGPWHGFKFLLTVIFGSLGMAIVALLVNNVSSRRRWPTCWF